METEKGLVVFRGKRIRRVWYSEQWFFSVIDIIAVLTESADPRNYWKVLKHRMKEEGGDETVTHCNQLKMPAEDGKMRRTDCANTETVFRIIQSVPSKNAEPFKLWLARVGYERVREIENPELAMKRMKEIYVSKGYSENWIEKRSRGIAVRNELTDEWEDRGIEREREFAILTADISRASFGMTPSEYRRFKGLKRENLRDHMTDLELIFTMLGEAATTEIVRERDARGFEENEEAALEGGGVAGDARENLEKKTGKRVSRHDNYLETPEEAKPLGQRRRRAGKLDVE